MKNLRERLNIFFFYLLPFAGTVGLTFGLSKSTGCENNNHDNNTQSVENIVEECDYTQSITPERITIADDALDPETWNSNTTNAGGLYSSSNYTVYYPNKEGEIVILEISSLCNDTPRIYELCIYQPSDANGLRSLQNVQPRYCTDFGFDLPEEEMLYLELLYTIQEQLEKLKAFFPTERLCADGVWE